MIARSTRILLVDAQDARAQRLLTRLREDERPTLVTHVRDPGEIPSWRSAGGSRSLTLQDARAAPDAADLGRTPTHAQPSTPAPYDVVLLALDESDPTPHLATLAERLPGIPVVTLGERLDDGARHALAERGVQGHVPGDCASCSLQPRMGTTIHWAVERQQLLAALDRARAAGVHEALHDALTGLPNRRLFGTRLAQLVAQAARGRRRLAVVFVDLDGFKPVNDSLGHGAGDALLIEVGRRLTACVRANDLVARHGGDEFTVVLDDLRHEQDAARVAHKILRALDEPLTLEGQRVRPGGSLGISLFPTDARDAGGLLDAADAAMYRAKADGGGRYAFYRPAMLTAAHTRLDLEAALRAAVRGDEFQLHWQPRRRLADGSAVGLEALLRWPRADDVLAPAAFLGVAREAGLATELDAVALDLACAQLHRWHDSGRAPPPVTVNLDPVSWRDTTLAERVRDALGRHALGADHLFLELREADVAADVDAAARLLESLGDTGVGARLDGFGAGGLALTDLARLGFTGVSLSPRLLDDPALLRAGASLAASVGLPPLACGLETDAQLQAAQAANVQLGQGFRLGRPAPAQTVESRAAGG